MATRRNFDGLVGSHGTIYAGASTLIKGLGGVIQLQREIAPFKRALVEASYANLVHMQTILCNLLNIVKTADRVVK